MWEGRVNGQDGYFHHSHVQEVRLRKGEYNDNRVLLVMLGILQTCFGVLERRIKVAQVSKYHIHLYLESIHTISFLVNFYVFFSLN